MSYPDKISVITPLFTTISTKALDPKAFGRQYVYLKAFGLLTVTRESDGCFRFAEDIQLDGIGNRSISLLIGLCNQIAQDTSLAGWKLDFAIASLLRVPRDSDREADARLPLMRLLLALGQEPIDAWWLEEDGALGLLSDLATEYRLPAEWDQLPAFTNPARLRQQLSGRVRSIWLAIARDRLGDDEFERATGDFRAFSMGGAMV